MRPMNKNPMSRHQVLSLVAAWATAYAASAHASAAFCFDRDDTLGTQVAKTPIEAQKRLASAEGRHWILERIAMHKGHESKCESGEIWTLHASGKVTITKCEEGRVHEKQAEWSVTKKDQLDLMFLLRHGDVVEHFVLVFANRKDGDERDEFRLRIRKATTVDPTLDMVFIYDPDFEGP